MQAVWKLSEFSACILRAWYAGSVTAAENLMFGTDKHGAVHSGWRESARTIDFQGKKGYNVEKRGRGNERRGNMEKAIGRGIFYAVLAAALYALNSPLSKILLNFMPSTLMAGFLYIGAGLGMGAAALVRKARGTEKREAKLTAKELPYTIAMILLDIAAPICLLLGLRSESAANVSLLNNFEIVATALIALAVFKEKISLRLWAGILFVVLSCALLSVSDFSRLQFSYGSLFVLLACVCWGLENNCTRKISSKDPLQIVLLKGIFSGLGSVAIGLCIGERVTNVWSVFAVLGVGLVAYGLSIFFYVHAQRLLGAARTSAYYAIAPFIGTLLSLAVFREIPPYTYFIALALMAVGAWLCSGDKPLFRKKGRINEMAKENENLCLEKEKADNAEEKVE